jgi:hypothetical protein
MDIENLRQKLPQLTKKPLKYLFFIAFLFLVFLRASTDLHQKPDCEQLLMDWYDGCMTEFDENPRKSGDLGLIKVTPAIELLLEAGFKHSKLPLRAEDKNALRNYCVTRSVERIKKLSQECK